MKVGIPIELSPKESRVGATPKTVERLKKQGFYAYIQSGAGKEANYSDEDYTAAGAIIVDTMEALYRDTDIILKVLAPTDAEIDMMHAGQVSLSYLGSCPKSGLVEKAGC